MGIPKNPKYGLILGLITQRPVEMSDTVISQCSNFLIFKMNHPTDVEYIKKMVPNISDEIVEKQKSLQSGTCLAFGSAFKIPLIVKLKMPNPMPMSGNCDVVRIWDGHSNTNTNTNTNTVVNNNQNTETSSNISNAPTQEVANTNMGIPEVNINQEPVNNVNQPINEVNNIEQAPINNTIPNNSINEASNNMSSTINEIPNINNQTIEQPTINQEASTKENTYTNINQNIQNNVGEGTISPIPEININNTETL